MTRRRPDLQELEAAEVLKVPGEAETALGRLRRRPNMPPVRRFEDRYVRGLLDMRALEFPYLLEFVGCEFEQAPDLRQAKIAGVSFEDCLLPGVHARNLRSDNDLTLLACEVFGAPLDLTDADITGSLVLDRSSLDNPGTTERPGRALHGNRLVISGALLATRLRANGELRLPSVRIGGNLSLRGASLRNPHPDGKTLNLNAAQIAGNLMCGPIDDENKRRIPFESTGLLFITSTHITSDVVLRGAQLHREAPPESQSGPGDPYYDPQATLVADRMSLEGNLLLDFGLRSTGTLRMVNAAVGGSLRLAGSRITVETGLRALTFDGTEVSGDMYARDLHVKGQARMVDVKVRGSVQLDRAELDNPRRDALEARRFSVGGNLECQSITVQGSMLLPGATVVANFDLRGATLTEAGVHTRKAGRLKPSLDIRAASVGRDLLCNSDEGPFVATGGLRLHRAVVGREANLSGVELGSTDTDDGVALNAMGLSAQELVLKLGRQPRGAVILRQARCSSFGDNANLYSGKIPLDMEGFTFDVFTEPIELTDDKHVERRLEWLNLGLGGNYRPGPYDQLAAVLRATGNEEHSATVLIRKQRQRYAALARGYHVFGPSVRMWSCLQRWVVGYGYRPMRAIWWLILLLAVGTGWFSATGPLQVINSDDHLPWNPFLFTLDLLIPIIDFGNKDRWQVDGTSQWVAAVLVASGWILATTVAAGATRMLRRNS